VTGCQLVEEPDPAVDLNGDPCVPCLPTTDLSKYTLAADGTKVACYLEEESN
jgi:hypothetical protein